jgi:hypothetical protein
MRKIIIVGLLACAATAVIVYALKKADVHHSAERRAWKNAAINAIEESLRENPATPAAAGEEAEWMSAEWIHCMNGDWLAYRQQCHKQDPKVHDIFIAKGSDGRWYYSDYHFCVGAMVLDSDGQPESLKQFKDAYYLVEFDGDSDDALNPTWNP